MVSRVLFTLSDINNQDALCQPDAQRSRLSFRPGEIGIRRATAQFMSSMVVGFLDDPDRSAARPREGYPLAGGVASSRPVHHYDVHEVNLR